MFQQPSQGDQVKISELLGSLVLIYPRELREQIVTSAGVSDAISGDLHVLDGPKAGTSYENTLIFGKALVGPLRNAIGGDPVLGRIGQGVAAPGKNAAWVLQPYTDADAQLATAWINSRPKFQAAANPTAAPAAAAAPSAAPSPASPGNGGQVDLSSLPPELQAALAQLRK